MSPISRTTWAPKRQVQVRKSCWVISGIDCTGVLYALRLVNAWLRGRISDMYGVLLLCIALP